MARPTTWNDKGIALANRGRWPEAEAAYLKAIEVNPRHADAWYNLALVYKRLRRWEDVRRCNLRAAELDPENDAALWNLGIAATALGDWPVARDAWRRFGVPIPDGTGPLTLPDLGPVPIRLDPQGNPEVVWCRRIDPARAIIENIPLPTSNRRHGDLLLHDGAPNGYRVVDGVKVPVFDEIELLQASACTTFRVRVEVRARPALLSAAPGVEEQFEALELALQEQGVPVEDWTTSIRRLCKACSEGTPHEHTPHETGGSSREMGVAAVDPAEASRVLEAWARAAPGRTYGPMEAALRGSARH